MGETLDGYRVQKVLHRSERSNVYLVVDQQSGKEAVMKTPSELYKDDPAYIERFIMERWVQSRIHHKNVLQSVDAPNHPSYLYSLSEHIEGQRLADWIEAHPDPSMEEVLPIIKQIALGVEALHRRETLHQDLKPDNILIGSDGIVKLLDFGSCRVAGIDEIDLPVTRDTMLGTVYYSAPEYRRGQRADRNADLFSIGVIAYEMITGYLPYEEQIEDIHSDADIDKLTYVPSYHRRPSVPVWVDGALWKAVRIDPAKRYEEISEFVFDLEFPNRLFARDAMTPLLQPSPVRNWKIVCALLFFLNLLFIYLLATSGTK